ncbi:unnamed protein product (macronuclear) [Paramecium tetraurelia]|uniref:Protein kinase domain-containing protein n=1 Tax=Paramecium tetraurelia TaxID=5888 RepID=A0BJM1_PARTE|nr:uncharacterized protein GSPATT00029366001 [Paramecium tetraurelia]CAK58738.1 unnamed protein product [Paramecium tetraurelia]|eukprot:XP_001426136.1 hypothetical protein (macronuclear) [Paramecium tetraurelia strain d4-2]
MQHLTRPQQQLQEINVLAIVICSCTSKSNIKLSQSFNPSGLLSQSPTHKTNQSSGFQGIDQKQLQKCQGQLLQGKQYKKELLKLMTSHKQLSTQKSNQQNNISDSSNILKTIATTDTRRTNSNQLQKSFIQTIKNQSFVSVANQIVVVVHSLNQQYKFTMDPQKSTGYMMEYLKTEMKKNIVVYSTTGSSSNKNKLQCETGNECLDMEIVSFHTVDKNLPIDFYIQQLNKPLDIFSGQTLNLQPFYGCIQGSQITLKDFIFIKCIGVGGFSRVYLVKKKSDGRFYAMKLIDKEFIIQRKKQGIVQNERDIMTVLDHPFINKLEYAFESKNFIVFVLEFCSGGELFWQLKQVKRMTEDQARFYFTEICLAIYYLHSISVVYRDIKPENILIDMDGHIRIADFGLSKPNMNEDDYAYSFCGSPEYMAPEMLLKVGHNVQVDHYCLGALLYELVTGLPPYYSRDTEEIYESILSEELTFPDKINLTDDIKDLLKGLLCKKPQSRLGAQNGLQELMLHPWFKGCDWIQILQKNIEPPFKPNQLQFHYDQNELLKGELETREKLLGKSGLQKDIKIFKTFYFDVIQQKQMKIEQSKVLKQHFMMITQIQMQLTQKYNLKKNSPGSNCLSKQQSRGSQLINQKQKNNIDKVIYLNLQVVVFCLTYLDQYSSHSLTIQIDWLEANNFLKQFFHGQIKHISYKYGIQFKGQY